MLDRGLHYGDGLFETIACLDGQPRLLDRHLERLAAGCERLGLPPPPRAGAAKPRSARALDGLPARGPQADRDARRGAARGYAVTARASADAHRSLRYAWPPEDARAAQEGVRVRLGALRLGENPRWPA